ncbi:hypothetical protein [Corynebacterium macclintockiae]|uniref:hypothetical protein n=1 Tax=Corynebacterium macclintockiae TaxID=2913501 RepID=UPI003EBCBCA0
MSWTPHDLPYITHNAADTYRDIAEFCTRSPDAKPLAEHSSDAARFLDRANLSWLDADMCDMLSEMWHTVPNWTPSACIPDTHGLMAFEKHFFTAPYESATDNAIHDVPVRAIGWEIDAGMVRITIWGAGAELPANARSPLRANLALEKLLGIVIPHEAVVDGAQDVERSVSVPDSRAFDKAALTAQAVAGSAWLLMSQPRTVTDAPTTSVVRKKGTDGRRVKTPVRVSIRSLATTPRGKSTPTGRKATSRWWVRGHWRQQAWGKNRAFRKPIFIAPHTAGNADAPIDQRPKIQVWRTGDTPETSSEATEGPTERN